jgi:branched-chain amino acid transport system permease protein
MNIFAHLMISGIIQGSLYALIALGFVLIYKSSSIFNFAHGELVMLGAFICWSFLSMAHFGVWASLGSAFIITAILGFLIQRLFISPLTGQPILSAILMTLALAAMLRGLTIIAWGSTWRSYPPIFPQKSIELFGVNLSLQHMLMFMVVMLAFGIFSVFFKMSKTGLAMRSTAEDHQTARSIGINVSLIFSLNWMIVCILATLGGFLMATSVGVVTALSEIGIKSVAVVLLGGLESIKGAVIAGILIGVIENIGGFYIDPMVGGGTKEIIPYFILIAILLIKPHGLFGLKTIERV